MRLLTILGSVFVVLLLVFAAAIAWATWPVRFAGIDRDPARAAPAVTVADRERPDITRREIVELLRAREFDTLTRIVENRNQRALADAKEEWELGRVIDAFQISDDTLSPTFDDWVQASPTSYAPLLASAEYRFGLAYMARGKRFATDTTPEQFAGMSEQLQLLAENLAVALRIEPRLSEAYRLLIDHARTRGHQGDCGTAARAGLDIMPASFRIRAALASCRLPRWGGNYRRVQEIADAADAFVADNPRLSALHGIVEWDKGRLTEGDESIGHFAQALTFGEHWTFYHDRGNRHRLDEHYREALDDFDAALALAPDSPDILVDRLYALARLGRGDQVAEVVELVEAIDPMNADLPGFKDFALKLATYNSSELTRDSRSATALEPIDRAIALGGGDSNAYLVRGRAHLQRGDHASALADFEKAIQLDPLNYTACVNIDYVLAQRGEWPRIIQMWNAYIARKPDDGKAIFERAGAYRHSGNQARAMQDASAACDLGVAAACAVVRR
jgi:tetratricopeptide (TPR) repeat protein